MFFALSAPFFWGELVVSPRWARTMTMAPNMTFQGEGKYTRNPYLVSWLVLTGERTIEVDGVYRQVRGGELVFFHPNTRYRLLSGESQLEYLSIGCELTVGAMELSTLYKFPLSISLPEQEHVRLHRAWLEMIRCFDEMTARLRAAVSALHGNYRTLQDIPEAAWLVPEVSTAYFGFQSIVFRWLQLVMNIVKPDFPEFSARLDRRVKEVCTYIHQRFHEPLSLAQLAEQVFVSQSHLSYFFVRALGCPPMEYVRRFRLQQAKRLLVDSKLSIKEIAERTGFEDQGNFSRAFRRTEQISPLAYRKQWLSH